MMKRAFAAVVAHKRAHLNQRHDLVVLPFVAWQTALPFLPAEVPTDAAIVGIVDEMFVP